MPDSLVTVAPGVARLRDTCNVYAIRSGREATLVDFGSGAILDRLDELGVDSVTDVLVTHHHRDQVQGLARAAAAGIRVWVPPVERDLIAGVDRHWQARPLANDYDLREDRFSLLDPVPVAGVVDEYRTRPYGAVEAFALPTPGHTIGSVTYLVERDGRRLAFSGDLLHGEGRVWSLAATQWTYTGAEGLIASALSCVELARREPDLLLPSHGEPMREPARALEATRARLGELARQRRGDGWDFEEWHRNPWTPLTPHLLRCRTTEATCFALLSESGAALLIDYGYDLWTGTPLAADRASRRPLLAAVDALKRDHGVERVEVVVPTHFHDDHVAGFHLLRDVEGTEVWAPEHVAPVLEEPRRYDLPCLWYDPIPVDRRLPLAEPVTWREYELTAHPQPGHTLHAAAIAVEVDGTRVLAVGDQQGATPAGDLPNYQYRNGFRPGDYVASAELYRTLAPDLILNGHFAPREVTPAYLERLREEGERVARLHRELLPEEGFGAAGFGARIEPYRATAEEGGSVRLEVTVRNPFGRGATASVGLVVPDGWSAEPRSRELALPAHGEAAVPFDLRPGAGSARRARVAADLTVDGVRFGQQAEALVDVA